MRRTNVTVYGKRDWHGGHWALTLMVVVPDGVFPPLKPDCEERVEYSYDPDPLYRRRLSNNEHLCAVIEAIAVDIKQDIKASRCHESRVYVVIWGQGDDVAMSQAVRRHFQEFVRGGS